MATLPIIRLWCTKCKSFSMKGYTTWSNLSPLAQSAHRSGDSQGLDKVILTRGRQVINKQVHNSYSPATAKQISPERFLSSLAAILANQNGRLPACQTLLLGRPALHFYVFIHKYSPWVLAVIWQGLAGAIFTLLGDRFLETKGDHRWHCAISLSYQSLLDPSKK